MNEKMMKILGGIIAAFVVFIIILFLISSCSKGSYSYNRLEEKMVEVAKIYYKNNEKELPANDKDFKVYTLKDMIHDGRIDKLEKLFGNKNVKCEGSVTVSNNNGYYSYSPYLSCGDEYQTKYLYEKIIEDNLVESNVGLYQSGDEYIMKGEVNTNYVSYGNKIFRIIRINEDKSIRLMENSGLSAIAWDDRYNEEVRYAIGINDYILNNQISSRIKESLDNYYENSNVWSNELKGYIQTQTLCIGKRSQKDTTKDGSTECSVKLENQNLGAIAIYEYLQASLDPSCSGSTDKNCRNYNWLGKLSQTIWTITADSDKSNYSYSIYRTPMLSECRTRFYANATFNLTDKAVYTGGNGTLENPYTFK